MNDHPDAELRRLRAIKQESCALLRALHEETAPDAHLAQSIITQHHINRLTELTQPKPDTNQT